MAAVGGELESVLVMVAERAAAAAEARRLDDQVVEALASTGLNRALLPVELDGLASPPTVVMEAVARIAAADGSAGWCSSISAGGNIFAGYIPEDAARRAYVDPDASSAGVFGPFGVVTIGTTGEATLTGRWPFASNCLHSRWIGLGAFVEDAAGTRDPAPRLLIVPTHDVVVEDTWQGAGLLATGSHHVRVDGVPVELERSCSFSDRPWPEGPLWKMTLLTVLAPILVSAPLGIARRAMDEMLGRVPAGAGGALRGALVDDVVGLAELGAADAALRAASAGLASAVYQAWELAESGQRTPRDLQARVMLAVGHAMDVAVDTTSTVHRLSGGAAAFAGHRALIALRDVETARQHIMFSHQHRPTLTRIAAGIDETAPPFVI